MTTEISRRSVSEPLDELPPRPIVKRWWFVPAVAAGILLGMFVLAVGLFVWQMRMQHYAAVQELENEVKRIQARGEPVTSDDFYAWHRVPAGTPDITQHWLKVLASFDETQFNLAGKGLPFVGDGDAALLAPDAAGSLLPPAEEFLEANRETLRLIHEAAKLEGECRFPVEFEQGIYALLSHAQKMRSVFRLLDLEARIRTHRGDYAGAMESIDAMAAAARTMEHQPTLVEHLVRIACLSVAFKEAEFLINETQLTEPQLARLQAMLQAIDIQSGLTEGMIGERGMGFRTFQQVHTLADIEALGGGSTPQGWEQSVSSVSTVSRPVDCQKYLELLSEMVAATREPFPAARERAKQTEAKVQAMVGSRNPLEKLKYVVTALMMPGAGSSLDAVARALARRDALVAAIAGERHRLKSGSYPTQMAKLVPAYLPAAPTDPYDGNPLRMIAGPDELVVYAIGTDGKDDSGLENESRAEPDVAVRVRAEKGTP